MTWYLDEFGLWFVLPSVPEDDKDLRSPWSFINLTMTSNIVRNGSGSSYTRREVFGNYFEKKQITFILTSEFILLHFSDNKTTDRHFQKWRKFKFCNVGWCIFMTRNFFCPTQQHFMNKTNEEWITKSHWFTFICTVICIW